jgi:anti-anti-sigma regulatory factor
MSAALQAEPQATVVALPAILDLAAADALCRDLRDAMDLGDVEVDARAVERISTPCIQLLLAAARSAAERGAALRIVAPSAPLSTAIVELGLGGVLSLED